MIQRLDRYTTARARDLRESGDIGSYAANVRRIHGAVSPRRDW